jgi:hypothetical protein
MLKSSMTTLPMPTAPHRRKRHSGDAAPQPGGEPPAIARGAGRASRIGIEQSPLDQAQHLSAEIGGDAALVLEHAMTREAEHPCARWRRTTRRPPAAGAARLERAAGRQPLCAVLADADPANAAGERDGPGFSPDARRETSMAAARPEPSAALGAQKRSSRRSR